MKLRNKKTGEIREVEDVILENLRKNGTTLEAICIDEIKEEWEDYKEPKEYFYIYADGDIYEDIQDDVRKDNGCKEIGNYFETKEEAERAVEKLKALKRLKDNGFKFKGWSWDDMQGVYYVDEISFDLVKYPDSGKDLDLLFGGEE